MIQITDMLAAMLEAQMQAAEWEQKFKQQFFGPLRRAEERARAIVAQAQPEQEVDYGEEIQR